MKYALIGCGRIATNHIKAVLNNGLELAAVCDIIPSRWNLSWPSTAWRRAGISGDIRTIKDAGGKCAGSCGHRHPERPPCPDCPLIASTGDQRYY